MIRGEVRGDDTAFSVAARSRISGNQFPLASVSGAGTLASAHAGEAILTMTTGPKPHDSHRTRRLLLAILAIAAGLRFYDLGSESVWLDEAVTAERVKLGYVEMSTDWDSPKQGPLFYLFEKAWCDAFGTREFALRFPSAVFGLLTVFAVYGMGRELFSERAGLIAALLVAANPFAIRYSQEARPYTLFFLLTTISVTYATRLARSPSRGNLVRHAVSTAGAITTHPYGVFVLGLHLVIAGIESVSRGADGARRSAKALLGGLAAAALLSTPVLASYAIGFTRKLRGEPFVAWISKPGIGTPVTFVLEYFESRALGGIVCLLIAAMVCLRLRGDARTKTSIAVLAAVVGSLILVPWAISFVRAPILVPRYTIPALGAVILLAGWALAGLPRGPRALAIAVLLVLTSRPLFDYYTGVDKDPWRPAARWLDAQVRPRDMVLVMENGRPPLEYYFRPTADVRIVPVTVTTDVADVSRESSRVWVVGTERMPPAFLDSIRAVLRPRFRERATHDASEGLDLNPRSPFWATIRLTLYESISRAP